MKLKNHTIFIISFLLSFLVYFFLHGFEYVYYAAVIGVFSSFLLISYTSKKYYFYCAFAVILAFIFLNLMPLHFLLQLLSLSLLVQALFIKKLSVKTLHLNREIELRRDLVQIIIGGISLLVLFLLDRLPLVLLVLFGMLSAHVMLVYGGKLNKFTELLEREGVIFGSGAMFMAVGSLLLLGFITRFNLLFLGLFALLISDPVATVAGLSGGKKPGKKSIAGSAAFFASLAIPGVLLFGLFGALFAFVLALAERFSPIDDNLFIPIVSFLLSLTV